VADCVIDVAAIADALGYERFYSVGGSGAGPHSIACAALLAKHTGARPELRPNAGHLSMAISSYGDILDGLLGLPSLWR
jgi:hypothetical protein